MAVEGRTSWWQTDVSGRRDSALVSAYRAGLAAQRFRTIDQKTLDDVEALFSDQRTVKSLYLTVGTERECQARMLEVLLGGVKGSLTSLTLSLDFGKGSSPLPSLEDLPCLTHLSLGLTDSNGGYLPFIFSASSQVQSYVASLLPAVRNIVSLTLLNDSPAEALAQIAKLQEQDPSKFSRLKKIVIDDCSDDHLKALVSLRQGSLTTLEIRKIGSLTLDVALLLRNALERFGDSLQELAVEFRPGYVTPTMHIHFPSRMKDLRTLSIFLRPYWIGPLPLSFSDPPSRVRVHFGGPPGAEPLNGNGDEEGGVNHVDYGRHFPSLAKLTLWPVDEALSSNWNLIRKSRERTDWGAFLPLLSAFLPSHGPPFPFVVKALDIPFLLQGKYHPVLDNLEAIFPAVAFPPELAQARVGAIWTKEEGENDGGAQPLIVSQTKVC